MSAAQDSGSDDQFAMSELGSDEGFASAQSMARWSTSEATRIPICPAFHQLPGPPELIAKQEASTQPLGQVAKAKAAPPQPPATAGDELNWDRMSRVGDYFAPFDTYKLVPLAEGDKGWKTLKAQANNLKALLTYDTWATPEGDEYCPAEFAANRLVPPYIKPLDMLTIMSTDMAKPPGHRKFDWKPVEKTYQGAIRVQLWVKLASTATP